MSSPWSQSSEERAPQCLGLAYSLTDKAINPSSAEGQCNEMFNLVQESPFLARGEGGEPKTHSQGLLRKPLFSEHLQCPTFRLRLPRLVLSFMQLTISKLCLRRVHFWSDHFWPLSKKNMSCLPPIVHGNLPLCSRSVDQGREICAASPLIQDCKCASREANKKVSQKMGEGRKGRWKSQQNQLTSRRPPFSTFHSVSVNVKDRGGRLGNWPCTGGHQRGALAPPHSRTRKQQPRHRHPVSQG